MLYRIKARGVQGESGKSSLFYTTLEVEAPDTTEAERLGMVKTRQRFFGSRDVSVMSVVALSIPTKLVVEGNVLRRTLVLPKAAT